jgi:hypothetical protein
MRRANAPRMAAVFAFIFLFGLAATTLLYKVVVGSASFASISALAIFVAMAAGIFIGCFKMMKDWEGPETH